MKKILLYVTCLLLAACGKKQAAITRPVFSSDSAYAFIERQMAFGPRVPNSKAHNDCAVWLIQTLREQGAIVELQRGQMPDYRGNMQQIYNIIAHFNTPQTANRPRVLLGAHYDTRPWCDEEENYNDRYYNVPGANDGASGVGVLLERVRGPDTARGAEREDTWCLGAQLWATSYAKINAPAYQYGMVLDMVGAPDASFPRELYSTQYAANYQQQIWNTAEKLGYGNYFNNQQSYPITDDHYYVNYIAGIPCVDIIHYDIRNATGFPHWWHTRKDNMDNISKSTIQAVGEVVMSQL